MFNDDLFYHINLNSKIWTMRRFLSFSSPRNFLTFPREHQRTRIRSQWCLNNFQNLVSVLNLTENLNKNPFCFHVFQNATRLLCWVSIFFLNLVEFVKWQNVYCCNISFPILWKNIVLIVLSCTFKSKYKEILYKDHVFNTLHLNR